jgi:hypothetical protein
MAKTAAVHLTADEIDELFDAIDDQIRHWSDCAGCGDDGENARYARIIAGLTTVSRKLDAVRDQLEDE